MFQRFWETIMGKEINPMVRIATVCGGVMVPIGIVVGIFAKESTWVLAPIAGAIAAMGIFLGYFASKSEKD